MADEPKAPDPTPPEVSAPDLVPAEPKRRKPWHAPQFICTDVADTDTQGNAGNDGGPMGSLS